MLGLEVREMVLSDGGAVADYRAAFNIVAMRCNAGVDFESAYREARIHGSQPEET